MILKYCLTIVSPQSCQQGFKDSSPAFGGIGPLNPLIPSKLYQMHAQTHGYL